LLFSLNKYKKNSFSTIRKLALVQERCNGIDNNLEQNRKLKKNLNIKNK
jgi:hypothetical protein